jgi:hypothetical protein
MPWWSVLTAHGHHSVLIAIVPANMPALCAWNRAALNARCLPAPSVCSAYNRVNRFRGWSKTSRYYQWLKMNVRWMSQCGILENVLKFHYIAKIGDKSLTTIRTDHFCWTGFGLPINPAQPVRHVLEIKGWIEKNEISILFVRCCHFADEL